MQRICLSSFLPGSALSCSYARFQMRSVANPTLLASGLTVIGKHALSIIAFTPLSFKFVAAIGDGVRPSLEHRRRSFPPSSLRRRHPLALRLYSRHLPPHYRDIYLSTHRQKSGYVLRQHPAHAADPNHHARSLRSKNSQICRKENL